MQKHQTPHGTKFNPVTGITNETITIGTVFGGIVLNRDDARDTMGQYPSGFTVAPL